MGWPFHHRPAVRNRQAHGAVRLPHAHASVTVIAVRHGTSERTARTVGRCAGSAEGCDLVRSLLGQVGEVDAHGGQRIEDRHHVR